MRQSRAERNVETARRSIAAFSAGDFEAAMRDVHPEIEWHVAFRLPDLPLPKDVYRGREEALTLWRAFSSVWESLAVEIEEFLHADDERLVIRVRFVGRGAESGIVVDRVLFLAYRMRDGMLIYSRAHDDEGSARRDLGLGDG